ncbi:MAG: 1-(5-phosphoribosyl)-5-[(5-phosphoribosylamino)methylideneamino]imidazole-4-carboxamide isomerase [Clostridiaceae bacterium]
MIIFPAIDLKDGKPVRLYKGELDTTHVVAENAVTVAKEFESKGAEFIHMVDLDGAFGGSQKNLEVIKEVVASISIPVELGGGIRTMETIDALIEAGVSRVILGTAALNNQELVVEAVKKYGDKIAVGIDAKDEYVAVKGWVEVSEIHYIDLAKKMKEIGVKTIIFTDISRDGMLTGPNVEQLKKLQDAVEVDVIASGGIKSIDDIKVLKDMNMYGAITGKAIYSGTLDLVEAINLTRM